MGLDDALGVALAGMERQDQAMDWARQCEWEGDHGPAMAFVVAARMPEALADAVFEHCVAAVPDKDGRASALMVAAMAGSLSQQRADLADDVAGRLGSLLAHFPVQGHALARLSVQVRERVAMAAAQGWMPAMVDRLVGACVGRDGPGAVASVTRRVVETCIESGVGSPASSRRLFSLTRILMENGICLDNGILSALRRTMLAHVKPGGRAPSWPGTWIAIAHELDARPGHEGHDATKACDLAIASILEDSARARGNPLDRRQAGLGKLLEGITRPGSIDLVAMASNPAEWTGSFVANLMEKCAKANETLLFEVAAMAMMGGSGQAWEACMRAGGGEVLEKGLDRPGIGVATSMWDLAPNEALAGDRAARCLGAGAAGEIAQAMARSSRIAQALEGWDIDALHASISSALLDVQTVPTHLPGAPRRRM